MNKIQYIIQILLVVTLFGCTDEEIFQSRNEIEVTAEFANTRTTFVEDDGTTHVEWNIGDAIGLLTNQQNNLEYTALNNGSETKFTASGEKIVAAEGDKVFAYYPYKYNHNEDKNILYIGSRFQEYKENSSLTDFIYTTGIVRNNVLSLRFKHAFAFLKITIPIKYFTYKGDDGKLFINSTENISSYDFNIEKEEMQSLNQEIWYSIPKEHLTNKQDITCYIAILPQPEGSRIEISHGKENDEGSLLLSKNVPVGGFKAGNVYTLYLENSEEEIAIDAIIAFYKATNGDSWTNNTNWCSDKPLSEWYGISETALNGIDINLNNNNLSGIIPEEIGYIKALKFLNFGNNPKLSGNIPNSIGNLHNLALLSISNCKLTGEIPEEIGRLQHLWRIDLGNNQLTGSIPSSIGELTNLHELFIYNNK